MAVVCPTCGTVSPADVDDCTNCAEPLTTIGRVFHRHETAGKPPTWLERNRQQAARVKQTALAASDARMEIYMALERERLATIRQSESEQRSKDQRLFLYVAGLAVAVLIILIAVGLAVFVLP